MIVLPARHNSKELYIFLHGAFDTPWVWSHIIDEMRECTSSDFVLFYLDDIDCIQEVIESVSKEVKIKLVGFSLGGVAALKLCEELAYKKNIELFLISYPLLPNKNLVKGRLILSKALNSIVSNFNRRLFPLFLRGKLYTGRSVHLLSYVGDNDYKLIYNASGCIRVNIYSARLDFVSGSIAKQKQFLEKFIDAGINATFVDGGYSSHFAYLINRKKLVNWLTYPPES